MTTYLVTTVERDEEVVRPYCSLTCLFDSDVMRHRAVRRERVYQFDETCAVCGARIPAGG